MSECLVDVEDEGGRYPHRAVCSCGWRSFWGYALIEAAQTIAEAHENGEDFAKKRK